MIGRRAGIEHALQFRMDWDLEIGSGLLLPGADKAVAHMLPPRPDHAGPALTGAKQESHRELGASADRVLGFEC